jgi:hypothetical protein
MSTAKDKAIETAAHERDNGKTTPSGTVAGRTPGVTPHSDERSPGAEADRAQAEERRKS